MTSLLRPENVIHVKYIVAILIVKPIILDTFAGLCEDSTRISGGFVFETRVADAICRGKVASESLEGLVKEINTCFSRVVDKAYANEASFRISSPKCWLSVDFWP